MTAATLEPTPASQSLSLAGAALRFIAAMGIAILVTVGLFFLMRSLIWVGAPVVEDPAPRPVIEIAMVPPDEPVTRTYPAPPDDVVAPPPVSLIDRSASEHPINPIDIGAPEPVEVEPELEDIGQFTRLPPPVTFRVPPVYPIRMLSRGIEGSCTVQYDILGSGRTANARVIDCDHSGFERASVDAVAEWRHAVDQGAAPEAVIQRGVQTRLDFQLDG